MTERPVGRVFLVTWWFDQLGGMERHLVELACALKRAGVDVMVFSELPVPADNQYRRQLAAEGVPLVSSSHALERRNACRRVLCRVPLVRRLVLRQSNTGTGELTRGDLLSQNMIDVMEGSLNAGRPDVIHVHGVRLGQSWVLEWARQRGLPTVYTEHVAIMEEGGPFNAVSAERAMAASALTCVSDHSRRSLGEALPRPRAIGIVHHIIREPTAHDTRHPSSPFQWVCVARLDTGKGIDVLLEAFRECATRDARYHLTLAGAGPERRRLERQARSLGIMSQVRFLGQIDASQVSALLHASGAFVLASRSEGQPVALLEAMSHAKPIVASAVGGIPELVHDGESGLLVAADDAPALASALRRVSEGAALRARLEAGALEAFRQSPHHERSVVHDMLALYDQARRVAQHTGSA